ncbi:MAG: ABC transporter substrate-binding protein [Planctomycetota bacterium]|nr:ABC transporter substrate-binding protein [Planctomycetota bacterium]
MKRVTSFAVAALSVFALSAPAMAEVPVFPNEDRDADPAVTAEKGGKGFGKVAAKLGFVTNVDFKPVGSPNAKKGGELIRHERDYPRNFRPLGPQANTAFNYLSRSLMYDTLLRSDPNTSAWLPNLATHWKKSKDGMTFWYRINPNAKWADGSPITSEDVRLSWRLRTDKTLGSPTDTWEKFQEPICESKYIVKVVCKKKNWRNFLYFSEAVVLPGKQLKEYVDGKENAKQWVTDYNTKFMMPSGPYEIKQEDLVTGQRFGLRRRANYWNEAARVNVGRHNFDRITRVVISDSNIAFERLKKGEKGDINLLLVSTARRWVKEMRPQKLQDMARGLIQKRKIFNEQPQGVAGSALNMRDPILKDVNVRKALTLLLNRKRLLKELMFNQYIPTRSYWPGTEHSNPANPKNRFDPEAAIDLLGKAGYEINKNGLMVKKGTNEQLTLRLTYATSGFTPHLSIYQEALKKVGINLSLNLTRGQQLWGQLQERKYQMCMISWGALQHPNPETSYKGSYADQINNNNVTGVKNAEIDALIAKYDKLEVEDKKERVECIQKIDGILAKMYPYVLFWYGPYERFLYWNKFSYPESGISRTGDYDDVEYYWWFDAEKAKKVEECRADKSKRSFMKIGKTVIKYWANLRKKQKN